MTSLPTRARLRTFAPIGLLAAVVLTACGTTEDDPDEATSPDAGDETSSPEPEAETGPIAITDARGKEVELDGPAETVVSLEWMETENLVTLGVMPAGVADVEGYGTWDTASPLDGSVADVGTRQEPSVDAIVALEPDLIIMERDSGPKAEQLEEYAPVIVVRGSDTSDNIGQMKANFTMIAEAVGKSDEAEAVLADFDSAVADGKAAIADAGHDGTPFAMVDGWTDSGSVAIRTFGTGSLFSDLAEALGLTNAWTGEVDEMWGLGQTDVEGLTSLTDAGEVELFYHAAGEDNWPDTLADNAIWQDLPFVKNDQVHPLQSGTWTFGGPASSMQFIDQVVDVLTS